MTAATEAPDIRGALRIASAVLIALEAYETARLCDDALAKAYDSGGYRPADWASPQLFALAEAAEEAAAALTEGSTERGCIREALREIELADTYVEKRLREQSA